MSEGLRRGDDRLSISLICNGNWRTCVNVDSAGEARELRLCSEFVRKAVILYIVQSAGLIREQ